MLSPHEIATLILLKAAPDPVDLDPVDLDALLDRQFVTLEKHPSGQACPRITPRGHSILTVVGRIR
ncbi:MAG: hypothetical protein ACREYA_33465 [Cupriavidus necator]